MGKLKNQKRKQEKEKRKKGEKNEVEAVLKATQQDILTLHSDTCHYNVVLRPSF